MIYIFNPKDGKKSARALERLLKAKGIELKLGEAYEALGVLSGHKNWAALAQDLTEEAVNRELSPHEIDHAHDAEMCNIEAEESGSGGYGPESALVVHTGFQLRYPAYAGDVEHDGVEYVRVCDPLGREVAYWICDEWQADPQLVMGAILGALARGRSIDIENKGSPNADKPRGKPLGPKEKQPWTRDRTREELRAAVGTLSVVCGALDDASGVVDAGDDEEYAYQAQLEFGRNEIDRLTKLLDGDVGTPPPAEHQPAGKARKADRAKELMLDALEQLLPYLEKQSQPGDTWPAICVRDTLAAVRKEEQRKAPVIQDVDFTEVSAVIIDGQYFPLRVHHDAETAKLSRPAQLLPGEAPEDAEDWAALRIGREDKHGFVEDEEVTLATLRRLTWDTQGRLFVDPVTKHTYRFILARSFGR